jgi:GNAT superfamily N-acetyltransferase
MSTPFLKTDRLTLLENLHIRKTLVGSLRCGIVNAWCSDDLFPTLIVANLLLVEMGGDRWLISHLLIEDEARRHGYGSEIIRFYEDRLGSLDACWCSDSGTAFAKSYVAKFGPRPTWQIGVSEQGERFYQQVMAAKAGAQ